jgi:hypothetical protein
MACTVLQYGNHLKENLYKVTGYIGFIQRKGYSRSVNTKTKALYSCGVNLLPSANTESHGNLPLVSRVIGLWFI